MIQFKQRGGVAAVICSKPFVALAKAQARVFNQPDLPLVIIDHPLGGLAFDNVKLRAAQALPQLLSVIKATLHE